MFFISLPSHHTQGGVQQFKESNPHLTANNQIFILAARDIEQCYPNQACAIYGNWRKTQVDLDAVYARNEKIINGLKKKQLAKYVGENITQQQFESDLQICYEALTQCWSLAY